MRTSPHPFTLRQLQYACAVAEHLSFRKAAELCRVAQPSLSSQVAELEAALGVQLFERDRRRVLVTAAGRTLIERARELLLRADDLAVAAGRLGEPFSGVLRVGVIPTVAPYLVPSATSAIRERYSRLTIQWVEDKTEVLVAELGSGRLDAALLALEAPLGDVEHASIAEDPFVLVAPPEHPLMQKRAAVTLAELRSAGMLLLDEGHCLRQQALEVCSSARAEELEFRATSLATLVQLVVQGAGVTLLPKLALETETSRAALGVRELAAPAPHRTLALIWRRASPLGPTLTSVAAAIRDGYPRGQPRRAPPAKPTPSKPAAARRG